MAILNADDGLWKWARHSSSNSVEGSQLFHYTQHFSIEKSAGNALLVTTSFGRNDNRNKKVNLNIDWNYSKNQTVEPELENLTSQAYQSNQEHKSLT